MPILNNSFAAVTQSSTDYVPFFDLELIRELSESIFDASDGAIDAELETLGDTLALSVKYLGEDARVDVYHAAIIDELFVEMDSNYNAKIEMQDDEANDVYDRWNSVLEALSAYRIVSRAV